MCSLTLQLLQRQKLVCLRTGLFCLWCDVAVASFRDSFSKEMQICSCSQDLLEHPLSLLGCSLGCGRGVGFFQFSGPWG